MNKEEILQRVKFLQEPNYNLELFFLINNEDEISVERGIISDDLKEPLLKDIIVPFFNKELENAEDVIDYDPTMTPDRKTLFSIDSSEIEQFELESLENASDFDSSNGYGKIWGYMIKVSSGENEIITVRKSFGGAVLQKKGKINAIFRNGVFTSFNEEVFSIDKNIDAFLVNGKFIVFQRTNFERSFLYDQKIKTQAIRNAKEMISEYKILDLEEEVMETYLDQHSISKLRKVDMSLIEDGTMDYENLDDFCKEYNFEITKNEADKKFAPSNKKEFKIFIKLLSDDFLESKLTNKKYDSHSKEILSN